MPSDGAPTLEQVGPETVWKSKSMPDLGLSVSSGYEYRVYVLECEASCLYVGIETRAKLAGRLRQHFAGRGAHFTKVHKPRSILMVWPATCTAVESYVYHALLAAQPAGRVEKLGGWTQTSTRVSPLAALQFEQARRSMRGSCFNCGGPHYASSCPKATQGCTYTCPKCKASILVSSRGQSTPSMLSGGSPSRVAQLPPPPLDRPSAPQLKRAAPPGSSCEPVTKAARTGSGSSGCVVSVCGKGYASLSWHLAKTKPTERECTKARAECGAGALAVRGGDLRTLAAQGFTAQPPRVARALMGDRTRLPSDWTDTLCKSVAKRSALQLRKAGDVLCSTRANQLLWRVRDLQRTFDKRA